MNKICKTCHEEKAINSFNIDSRSHKHMGVCKECEKVWYSKERRLLNKEKRDKKQKLLLQGLMRCRLCKKNKNIDAFKIMKKCRSNVCIHCYNKINRDYYYKNKIRISLQRKTIRDKKKEQRSIKAKIYYLKNKDKICQRTNQYKRKNKEKIRLYNRRIEVKLANKIRSRVRRALKGKRKLGNFEKLVGCTIWELKKYLEKKFYPNLETGEKMTWDNYNFYGWHIDHIIPLSKFDLTDKKQFLKACYYTNLQPMWAKENLSKSNKTEYARIKQNGGL